MLLTGEGKVNRVSNLLPLLEIHVDELQQYQRQNDNVRSVGKESLAPAQERRKEQNRIAYVCEGNSQLRRLLKVSTT